MQLLPQIKEYINVYSFWYLAFYMKTFENGKRLLETQRIAYYWTWLWSYIFWMLHDGTGKCIWNRKLCVSHSRRGLYLHACCFMVLVSCFSQLEMCSTACYVYSNHFLLGQFQKLKKQKQKTPHF